MKITRQRLKQIILEEINLMESAIATDVESDVTEDDADMGEISEGETWEITQQVAQALFDTGVTAAESPQELAMALKGLGKMALITLGGGALGAAGIAGKDAIDKLVGNDGADDSSQALEEDESDTLTTLITQAIEEQIKEMREENK
tara:strand:+ start:1669 stop:2109 length:441 start_codon:yes stop_codon:yes gene_type:complete